MATRPMECGTCGTDHPSARPCPKWAHPDTPPKVRARLIRAKLARHRAADPHCTCNDCIAYHVAHTEGLIDPGMVAVYMQESARVGGGDTGLFAGGIPPTAETETVTRYVIEFPTLELARAAAEDIHTRTGVIVAITAARLDRRGRLTTGDDSDQ